MMTKQEFYRSIERGNLQGACRYFEYWYIYKNLPKRGSVLELGAGRSALPVVIAGLDLGYITTEIDPECVEYQLNRGIPCKQVYDNYLPFDDESFDAVINASAIEHFDPEHRGDIITVSEVHRVLKPGGIFINGGLPAEDKFVLNLYAGQDNPPCIIYDEAEYKRVFLNGFKETKKEMYAMSNERPTDFVPHPGWRGAINTKPTDVFGEGNGLCVVLKKI